MHFPALRHFTVWTHHWAPHVSVFQPLCPSMREDRRHRSFSWFLAAGSPSGSNHTGDRVERVRDTRTRLDPKVDILLRHVTATQTN